MTWSRRTALQAIGGVFLGVAAARRPHWPGFFGGHVVAMPLEPLLGPEERDARLLPETAVTAHDDERIDDLGPLRAALDDPGARIELSRREFGRTFSALEGLPAFHPSERPEYDHHLLSRGIYVRDDEYTSRIDLVPNCSGTWWIRTRGTPDGRNRCHHR